jgi:hypothetical protein
MNVDIGAEAALFPEKGYSICINGIAVAVHRCKKYLKKGKLTFL